MKSLSYNGIIVIPHLGIQNNKVIKFENKLFVSKDIFEKIKREIRLSKTWYGRLLLFIEKKYCQLIKAK